MQPTNNQTHAEIAMTAALIEETVAPFTPADPAPVNYLDELTKADIPWVPCAPFPCSFVFFQQDAEATSPQAEAMRRLFPDFETERRANGTATEYFTDQGNYFVFIGWRLHGQYGERLPLVDRIAILTHEIHHAINFVLAHVGQKPDTSNDEITAYLHEYHMKAALLAVRFGEADEWRTNTVI